MKYIATVEIDIDDAWLHDTCYDHAGMTCEEWHKEGLYTAKQEIEGVLKRLFVDARFIEFFDVDEWEDYIHDTRVSTLRAA